MYLLEVLFVGHVCLVLPGDRLADAISLTELLIFEILIELDWFPECLQWHDISLLSNLLFSFLLKEISLEVVICNVEVKRHEFTEDEK